MHFFHFLLQVIGDHQYCKDKRFHLQPSRKVGCEARLTIRYITLHSEYAQVTHETDRQKKRILDTIRQRTASDQDYIPEKRIYVSLPTEHSHTNHEITPESALSKRIDEKVKKKIYDLVSAGFTTVPVVKKTLKIFVDTEFAANTFKPNPLDRSYFPLSRDIKNHIHLALLQGRLADLDQENVKRKIDIWKQEDKTRNFYFRQAGYSINGSESREERFIYVHQEQWQQKLLTRYGNTLCLLDATYKTTKYALPLFLLVVRTNVDYVPVAEFVVEDETTDAIREALSVIKSWNPNWCPPYFMTDYSEAEINAVEAEFCLCKVFLCSFHREQAWERCSRDGNKK